MSKIAKKRKRLNIISNVYAFLVYALLYIPVAVMMVFSFNDQKYNYYWNGFTTQWYTKLFTNSTLVDSLIYSLIIAVLSTLISVFIGTIGALGLKRYEFKMKKFIDNMLYVPIIVPEIVLAVALLIIFLKVGVSMGIGTILIGHCTFCIPYAIVTIKGRISGDNETLEEASMDLGANRVQTLLRVYAEKTGLPAIPKSIGGGTYAKAIPNVVAFGPIFPGDEVREHKPDEFIEVDKLMENAQILAEALYQLAK